LFYFFVCLLIYFFIRVAELTITITIYYKINW